ALKDAPDLASARQRITDALAAVAFDIEHHAGRVDSETGWSYMGIDLSPAPSPAKDASMGAAIEELTKQPFGLSGTLTAAAALKDAPDLASARQRITDALAAVAFDIEHHAGRVDSETGWSYMGIDLSPAPSPAKDASMGAAIEELTKQPFGLSGTLTAAATLTAAIRDVKVK